MCVAGAQHGCACALPKMTSRFILQRSGFRAWGGDIEQALRAVLSHPVNRHAQRHRIFATESRAHHRRSAGMSFVIEREAQAPAAPTRCRRPGATRPGRSRRRAGHHLAHRTPAGRSAVQPVGEPFQGRVIADEADRDLLSAREPRPSARLSRTGLTADRPAGVLCQVWCPASLFRDRPGRGGAGRPASRCAGGRLRLTLDDERHSCRPSWMCSLIPWRKIRIVRCRVPVDGDGKGRRAGPVISAAPANDDRAG